MTVVVALLAVVLPLPAAMERTDDATVSAITANTASGSASANPGSASERRVSAPTPTIRPSPNSIRNPYFERGILTGNPGG
jgi:hypothetical protein